MKTLYLLRHAKSDRATALQDKDRPLNERGRSAAPKIGAAMAERGYLPDVVLVSTAERTRQTWALVAPELGAAERPVEFRDNLYLASAMRLFETVRNLDPTTRSALLVGHNPGIEDLASRLAAPEQTGEGRRALERLATKYPTAALTVLEFDITDWQWIRLASGALAAFLTPSML